MTDVRKGEVYAELNCHKTPKEFKKYKQEFERLKKLPLKKYEIGNIASTLMNYIEDIIGRRKTSYAWWVNQKLDIENHDKWFTKKYGTKYD